MPHTLILKDVYKKYKNQEILRGISLPNFNQKFLSLVGPAGSGKSTLLRLIGGIELPSRGSIFIDGGQSPQSFYEKGKIEYLGFDVTPSWTVEKYLRKGIRSPFFSPFRTEAKIQALAKEFYLRSLDRKLFQLSTSELYRVLFAKVLHSGAPIILLDTALSFLDEEDRDFILSKLLSFKKQPETMIIYASHDFEEVAAYADETLILRGGILEQQGSPQEVYDCPESLFVAYATGRSKFNKMMCPLIEESSGRLVVEMGQNNKLPLTCRGGDIPSSWHYFHVGVRPHHVILGSQRELSFQGVVEGFRMANGQGYLEVSLSEETSFLVPYIPLKGASLPQKGSMVSFSFNVKDCLFFDETGQALFFSSAA